MKTIAHLKSQKDLPLVVANEQGMIVESNQAFTHIFGWKKEEILGQPLDVIIPKDLRDAHNMGFSRFLVNQQPSILGQNLVLKALAKNGDEFQAEHYIIAEKQAGNWLFAATMRRLN